MSNDAPPLQVLDLRDLPPPQPLFRIHEALLDLAVDAVLLAHTPCRPEPLLEWLSGNGWAYRVEEHPGGAASVWIARDGAARA